LVKNYSFIELYPETWDSTLFGEEMTVFDLQKEFYKMREKKNGV